MVAIPNFFANTTARNTFGEFPLVETARTTSPGLPIASSCRAKISWNPRSLPIAVNEEESVVRAMAARALRCTSITPDKLGGNVLRVSGAASVAEYDQLSSCFESFQDESSRFDYFLARGSGQLRLDGDALFDFFCNVIAKSAHACRPHLQ